MPKKPLQRDSYLFHLKQSSLPMGSQIQYTVKNENTSFMVVLTVLELVFVSFLHLATCGHEVLNSYVLKKTDLLPREIAIVQFDTRPVMSYWNTSFLWNKEYAVRFGHRYELFMLHGNCSHSGIFLSPAWCKVRAMLAASQRLQDVEAFVYLDSDAVMTVNFSLSVILGFMQTELAWNRVLKPVAFNQDGPGWSCKHALGFGFAHCFNSGTVVWTRSELAKEILEYWWSLSTQPYDRSLFPGKWRTRWPWEQAKMYDTFQRYSEHVQVLSFPNLPHLPWTSVKKPRAQYPSDAVEPWCFSHWPGADCFITHHCASLRQKMKMIQIYLLPHNISAVHPIEIAVE